MFIKSIKEIPIIENQTLFNETLNSHDLVLVLFFEPNECFHCKVYEDVMLELYNKKETTEKRLNKSIEIIKVKFVEDEFYSKRYPIHNSPSLFLLYPALDVDYDFTSDLGNKFGYDDVLVLITK